MASFLGSIVHAGSRDEFPDHLNTSLFISNLAGITFALFVGVAFSIVSELYNPELTVLPFVGTFIFLGVIPLNKLGLIHLSRLLISTVPVCIASAYVGLILPAGQEPMPALYLTLASFLSIAFVVYDHSERNTMLAVALFNILVLISYGSINRILEPDIDFDLTPLISGSLKYATLGTGLLMWTLSFVALIYRSYKSETKTEELLRISEKQRAEAEEAGKELKANLEKLTTAQEEEKIRQWVNHGVTESARLIRQKGNSQEVLDRVLAYMIKYIDANQGGIFSIKEKAQEREDDVLEMASCYAYDKKKYITKEFPAIESLTGQAYLEMKPIDLDDVPDDYVYITSGLGEATPRHLYLTPLIDNESVVGVVEIASFTTITDGHKSFIDGVSKDLASYMNNLIVAQRTNELLEQSQKQTEELRVKEEEFLYKEEQYLARIEELERELGISEPEEKSSSSSGNFDYLYSYGD